MYKLDARFCSAEYLDNASSKSKYSWDELIGMQWRWKKMGKTWLFRRFGVSPFFRCALVYMLFRTWHFLSRGLGLLLASLFFGLPTPFVWWRLKCDFFLAMVNPERKPSKKHVENIASSSVIMCYVYDAHVYDAHFYLLFNCRDIRVCISASSLYTVSRNEITVNYLQI